MTIFCKGKYVIFANFKQIWQRRAKKKAFMLQGKFEMKKMNFFLNFELNFF
jgi:hypothetical protein